MRGFTLIELMIAGSLAALVALAAFTILSSTQLVAASQQRATDRVARSRLAMELIGNDIRSAGDAVNFLPDFCMGPAHPPGAEKWACPAILDAHPWRLTLARNAWAPGPDGIPGTTDDIPNTTVGFAGNRENVVTYEFRPAGARQTAADGRQYYRGSLVRIEDPFGFGGAGSYHESLLLDDVVVDNRMVVSPGDSTENDERFDFAIFTYRLLSSGPGEFQGDPSIVSRNTTRGVFLLPPAGFYRVDGTNLPEQPAGIPYRPQYSSRAFIGSRVRGNGNAAGLFVGSGSTAAKFEEDLTYILADNRIRAVRVSFKAVTGDDRAGHMDGVDLDPTRPGTAPTVLIESTFELKVFATHLQ